MTKKHVPLAIVGMACRFPKADGVRDYWGNILNGTDCITDIPESHWRVSDYFDKDPKAPDQTYAKRGGFISEVPFNPLEYGIPPTSIEATDTSQLLGLVVASECLNDAGYGPKSEKKLDRDKVSVVLGVTGALELVIPLGARLGHPIWRKALKEHGIEDAAAEKIMDDIAAGYVPWQEQSFPGLLGNVVAGRIANYLDLGGTNCVADAACASALSAVHLAGLELQSGRADMVLTGGVDTFNDIFMYMCFSKTPALSPSGDARPFDANGDGTMLGEGIGIIALRRLEDAERDGDHIYAVLRGLGSSSDGKGNAIYAPSAKGQTKALRRAYEAADVDPTTIELVEGHGTGTKVGDGVEISALNQVYGQNDGRPWCALGSVKSQIGHTKAAAGIAGLIKAAMALNRKVLPPTIKIDQPSPKLQGPDSALYLNTTARPWMSKKHPRRAAVSAFGFGGSNFHCVLEEHQSQKAAIDWDGSVQILAFSAVDKASLKQQISQFDGQAAWSQLEIAAAKQRLSFDPTAIRLLVVVEKGKTDVVKILNRALSLMDSYGEQSSWSTPEGVYFGSGQASGKLGLLFPGQGAQYVDMLRDLACRFPVMQRVLADVDKAFDECTPGAPRLTDLIYPPPVFDDAAAKQHEQTLRETQNAQPAIGAVSIGALKVLHGLGIRPEAAAGHSYGEITALCASERFDTQALYLLSRLRGKLMAEGSGDRGAMLAVRAPVEKVAAIVAEHKLDLVPANKNAPEQIVLSGPTKEIDRAEKVFGKVQISNKRLPVAAAFHSTLVAQAEKPFSAELAKIDFSVGSVPVYSNTTAHPYPDDAAEARQLLATQLTQPVEFVDEINNMYKDGVRTFLEVGPGARLTGLVKSILSEQECNVLAVDASSGKRSGIYDLARVLASLAAEGRAVDLKAWEHSQAVIDGIKPTKKGMIIPLTGANYRNPKPAAPVRKTAAAVKKPRVEKQATQAKASPSPQRAAVASGARSNPVKAAAPKPIRPSAPVKTHFNSQERSAMKQPEGSDNAFAVTQQNMILLQQMQENTAKLHHKFLETQAEAQRNMHALMEQQRTLFQGAPTGVRFTTPQQPVIQAAQPTAPPTVRTTPKAPLTQPVAPAPVKAKTVETPAPAPVKAPAGSAISDALMAVVAEKTGYPVDMLEGEMSLDADLGIDSIKRVEILSAVSEALPDAPAVAPDMMGGIQTLNDIIALMGVETACAQPAAAQAPVTQQSAAPVLMAVIAEKTGYPMDMLDLSMSLDADLGIDSIKRVEILSALSEKAPHLPEIKPDEIGSLQTLADIVNFLDSQTGTPAPAPAVSAAVGSDVVFQTLKTVVADKTGYPVDMLENGMSLDADLGIDSIKRVEILSALQEALPELPAVEPDQMGSLQTLADIVDYLSQNAPAAQTASTTGVDVGTALFGILADKTGYPVDMLDREMNLESDLGIDSIKRVEIFSALADQIPELPELKPDQLTAFQNLGEIIDHLQGSQPTAATTATVGLQQQVGEALMVVVADKTGYPKDMLEMEMDLESDLGIDSIKRVEILSALQEAVNGLPELPAERMNELHTLQEVVEAFAPATTASPAVPAQPAAMVKVPVPAAQTEAPHKIIRSVLSLEQISGDRKGLDLKSPVWLVGSGNHCDELQAAMTQRGLEVKRLEPQDQAPQGPCSGLILMSTSQSQTLDALTALQWVQKAKTPLESAAKSGDALLAAITPFDGGFGLLGMDPSTDPAQASLCGLVKTASHEWPSVTCRVVDPAPVLLEKQLDSLADEMMLQGPLEVAINKQGIHQLRLIQKEVEKAVDAPLAQGDVVLVTGGARGVTAEAAVAIAKAFGPTLVLLGRSPLPQGQEPEWLAGLTTEQEIKAALAANLPAPTPRLIANEYHALTAAREIRNNMARMTASGAKVVYRTMDLLDTNRVGRFVEEITEELGPVRGLIHGAGVLADRLIEDKTAEQFNLVFGTKALSFKTLLAHLEDSDLKVLVTFSSSTARFGRKGQVDYAMANEVLNKTACREAAIRPNCRVVSVNWGPWDGGMVNDSLKQVFAAEGVGLIPLRGGADYLVSELSNPGGPVETVILGELPGEMQSDPKPDADTRLEQAFQLTLSLETHPFLKSHIINGKPVLPAAMMMEWMAQAALHANPGFRFGGFDQFRVQKGVILDASTTLSFMTGPAQNSRDGFRVRVEIQGERRHASAELLLVDMPTAADSPRIITPAKSYQSGAPVYEALFHGPDLQGIEKVTGLDPEGIAAMVKPAPAPREWVEKPLRGSWLSDPLAIDTAFQLMILWCRDQKDKPSLPTFAQSFRQYGKFSKNGTDIRIQVTAQTSAGAKADIEFLDQSSGKLIARMTGYECVLDKSLEQAFKRNHAVVGA